MKDNQLILFPELDPYKIKIKNIDYVDISTLPDSQWKKNNFSQLPKDIWYVFKSGGTNRYMEELGNCFPYIQNRETGSILECKVYKTSNNYPLGIWNYKDKSYKFPIHRVAAMAFIENDDTQLKTFVDHMDHNIYNYALSNLRWITPSENSKGNKTSSYKQGLTDREQSILHFYKS
jgi:hypothetical protein